ncbi:MAG: T9SS type A sorting domain-containing protein [Flavobacteriales bacterium]|nr:T9SS type A sorting domain-containing protein [Flavobacteriales bacterium]
MLLYPDPTTDRIVILIPKGLEFADMVIEDMRGSVVLQSRTTGGSTTLDLEGLDPGLYTMRITGKGKTASGRFVKQ